MTDPLTRSEFERSYASRSPRRYDAVTSSILRERDLKINDPRASENIPTGGLASFRSPDKASSGEQSTWQSKKMRGTTPKKVYFFSDYLQGYDPMTSTIGKTPSSKLTKERETIGSENEIERPFKRKEGESLFRSKYHQEQRNRTEDAQVTSREDVREEKRVSLWNEKENTGRSDLRKDILKGQPTPKRAETTDSPSRRFRDLRRSEIKERLSRLNEKLSSPTERVPLTSDFKHGEDPANKFKPRAFRSFKDEPIEEVSRSFENDIPRVDNTARKSPRRSPARENYLKTFDQEAPIGKMPSRDKALSSYGTRSTDRLIPASSFDRKTQDLPYKPRSELQEIKNEVPEERFSHGAKLRQDTQALSQKVKDLERQIADERNRYRHFQNEIVDMKRDTDEASKSGPSREFEKVLKQKEQKISELEDQIASLDRSLKDANQKSKFEHEAAIKRIKTEHEFEIKKLSSALEAKERRIVQLERENKEMEQKISQRINNFQDQLQNQQESFAKIKQNLEAKTEENNKLNRKLAEANTEISFMKDEIKLLQSEKLRIESENRKLKEKLNRPETSRFGN